VLAQTSAAIQSADAKLVAGFATLGAYDVMSILEARDDEHVAAVDARLAELGYYVVIEKSGIVDLKEFVQLSRTSPVFVQAWLQGRRERLPPTLQASARAAVAQLPAAKAASPARRRSDGADERKGKRAPAEGVITVGLGSQGPFPVRDFGLAGTEGGVTLSFSVPEAAAREAELLGFDRGAQLPQITFELIADRAKAPASAVLRRVDGGPDGEYVVALEVTLPRALYSRVERKHQELLKAAKGR
jgi:hypothetical protein